MKNNQDNWEKIKNFTNEYEPEPNLANDVILKLNQRESTVKFKKSIPVWTIVLLFFAVTISLLLIVYFYNRGKARLYLNNSDLTITDIEDIDSFVSDRNLHILYDNSANCITKSAITNSNNKLAYIEQNYFFIGNDDFEEVNLKIVFIDAVYDFSESFNALDTSRQIEGINTNYKTIPITNSNHLYAKFILENVEYYLEVKDITNTETTLEGVILSLMGQ